MSEVEFNEYEPDHPETDDTPESKPNGKAIWRKLRATRHFLFLVAIYAIAHGFFEVGLLRAQWRPDFYEMALSVTNIPAGGYICITLGAGIIILWVTNGEFNWIGRWTIMGLRAMWEQAGRDLERKLEVKVRNRITAKVTEQVTAEVTEQVTAEVTEQVTAEVTEQVTAEVTEHVTAEAEKDKAEAVAKARAEGIAIGRSQRDNGSNP